jgi:opacity protein-like surface antigen
MKRIMTLALVSLSLSAGTLQAEEQTGWTVGLAGVFGKYKRDDRIINDNAVGVRAFAEYRLNSWLGFDASYLNSGRYADRTPDGTARQRFDGFTGGLLGYLPLDLEGIDLYGKAGYFTLNQDLSLGDEFASRRTTGLTLGAGGRVALTERIGVRLEYDWFGVKNGDLWNTAIGVDYRF